MSALAFLQYSTSAVEAAAAAAAAAELRSFRLDIETQRRALLSC
jgi:hypothetical protein